MWITEMFRRYPIISGCDYYATVEARESFMDIVTITDISETDTDDPFSVVFGCVCEGKHVSMVIHLDDNNWFVYRYIRKQLRKILTQIMKEEGCGDKVSGGVPEEDGGS